MIKNMCSLDRGIRFLLGIVLILVAFFVPAVSSNSLVYVLVVAFSAVNFISAGISFCPVYYVAGLSTTSEAEGSDT